MLFCALFFFSIHNVSWPAWRNKLLMKLTLPQKIMINSGQNTQKNPTTWRTWTVNKSSQDKKKIPLIIRNYKLASIWVCGWNTYYVSKTQSKKLDLNVPWLVVSSRLLAKAKANHLWKNSNRIEAEYVHTL